MSTTVAIPAVQASVFDSSLYCIRGSTGGSFTYNNTYVKTSARTIYRDKQRVLYLALNGYLPQNPYSVTHTTWIWRPTVGSGKSFGANITYRDPFNCYPNQTGGPAVSGGIVTTLENAVHADTAASLNSQVRNQYYSIFETLYEGKKTVKMVTEAAVTIATSLRDVRKGRFASAARRLGISTPKKVGKHRKLSDNWLEYRYGWTPLYLTVYGEMKRQYDNMRNKEPVRRVSTLQQRAASQVAYSTDFYLSYNGLNLGNTYRVRKYDTWTVRSKRVAYYRVHNPTLANSTQLGITNPALLAWEAIPLSFVADWFVNVSDVLEQFDAWLGKTYLVGTKTTTVIAKRLSTPEMVGSMSSPVTNSFGSSTCNTFRYARVIETTPPTVGLRFTPTLNLNRLVDAVSLIRQLTR